LALQGDRLETRIVQVVPRARRRFAANYRQELEQASNLTTYLHANLTELETNETGNLVGAAHVTCLSGNRFTVQAKYFVLAASGIENPRLLLLSNRRHANGLGNQHDVVGRYFMEHPRLVTGILAPANPNMSLEFYSPHRASLGGLVTEGDLISGYVSLSDEALRKERILDVQMDLNPVYDPAYAPCTQGLRSESVASARILLRAFRNGQFPNDLRGHLTNVLDDMARWRDRAVTTAPLPLPTPEAISRVWQADPGERTAFLCETFGDIAAATYMESSGSHPPLDHVQVTTRVEQAPNPDSRITLDTERDRLGLNKVRLDWQLTSLDKRSMIRALEILGAEVGAAGIGRLQITLPDGDSWPEPPRGGWHLMGTTRMSDNPRKGVVDRNCQVHGVHNLFVAGSSVFPTAGSGTPTLTLVGLAIRLADHLKARMT
jgi:choline dehydrogenase-like flavoprotein